MKATLRRRFQRVRDLDGIRFSVVPFAERKAEILELRSVAYEEFHRLGTYRQAENLTDPHDAPSSMVIAERDGMVIGSVRLAPPLAGPILNRYYPLCGSLSVLPPQTHFIESGWGCIHPEHQGRGLFWYLVGHKLLAARAFGVPYIVGSTAESLWPLWQSCGYRKIELSYPGMVTGIHYSAMRLELDKVLAGEGIAPVLSRVFEG